MQLLATKHLFSYKCTANEATVIRPVVSLIHFAYLHICKNIQKSALLAAKFICAPFNH